MKKKSSKTEKVGGVLREIRHLGVKIETVDDHVKLIAEQYGDIKDDISGIKETLDSHTSTLDSHTSTLDSHTSILDSHTEMIGSIKEDVEIMKTDIEFIKNSLKKKIDVEEFAVLERRVALLEKKSR